ncbi:unnamed protein product [Rotaria sordida]|uniref:Protein LTV1 homolog n=1 Tax=Rotaria sordida TaxID=392033 RepID=A0A813RZ28_9BILA|nr:unnamed protein product [Rotaria sordida]CAF0870555.1 unnamed protein product [Rotaria sordida]CAF1109700.1 unnamed protein product [Rotaria sordida]CAF3624094.1 unnamed protein product [Rotaria sordida]
MPHRRKFIDKKKAITFQLVHRSQHDPLIADDTVGERVLVPLGVEQRKTEQRKFGIDYDDDYDYLQHLRDPCAPPEEYSVHVNQTEEEEEEEDEDEDEQENTVTRFNLPSTVFESKTTNEIGMLNLAAPDSDPKIHWDPDVIAALDDDEFDYDADENFLDDDFMLKANGIQPLADDECDEFEDEIIDEILPTTIPPRFIPKTNKPIPLALRRFLDQDDDGEDDIESNMSYQDDDDKQTSKTKYTNYSMTSSVIRRNQGLQNIDDHFDKIFDEYNDENIGGLDSHHINQQGASIQDDLVQQTIQQFEQQQMQTEEQIEHAAIEKTKKLAKRLLNEPEKLTTVTVDDDENDDEKWDCETILTTYSNIYNHPKLITQNPINRIRLSKKTGLPLNDNNNKIKIKESTNDDDDDDNESTNQQTITFERKKGETSEERRTRKNAVKEIRRDRRIIKKATKIAFKQEEQKQLHEQALNSTQAHLQSLRVT